MQTLFDHSIKDLINVSLFATSYASLSTLGWLLVKGSLYGGLVFLYFHMWSSSLMFGQLIITMITRYLLIFHSVKMINVNDQAFVIASRLTVLVLASLTLLGEHLTSDYTRSISFVKLTGIVPEEGIINMKMYFILFWVFSIILVVGYVMIRIELMKMKFLPLTHCKNHIEG